VKFLVDLRADLLPLAAEDPLLASLDDDLEALLISWFDVDFLELRRISWHTASGALLEKFMAYEAVHPVESWEDLKNRLDYDRRYFAFFHPIMPEEPLIFVEVALVEGMAGNVRDLLDPDAPVLDPSAADTAIFYSISNAQKGLAGVSFGGFLIKRVVDRLMGEFPRLKTFSTLSPLPGFIPWLERALREDEAILLHGETRRIGKLVEGSDAREWIGAVLEDGERVREESMEAHLRPVLLRLAARYLLEERSARGRALDPVAHFHLSNGARVERLNWMGDVSPRGMAQSAGIMVNYLYDIRRIEENHEAYRGRGRVVASSAVRSLLRG
jgi:malonyl-CoA decarboxylase